MPKKERRSRCYLEPSFSFPFSILIKLRSEIPSLVLVALRQFWNKKPKMALRPSPFGTKLSYDAKLLSGVENFLCL